MEAILQLVSGDKPKGRPGKPIAPDWLKDVI
jgi:hypothetical protein